MALKVPTPDVASQEQPLGVDFVDRLDASLTQADQERRRHIWVRRIQRLLPLILLVGPFIGWRLTLASPDGVHIGISTLAWLAFILDVGVHLDSTFLSGLQLQWLPALIGALIFVLVAVTLLARMPER
jgi:hypothetical protein